ncbi:MAG: UDP-N-acetylmuramate--L-alanine ligase, partial [Firmicutes bacterium]|nr:UDP-N-acetylmuramate--L-alanine ligase [Bacillota bacterium]
AAHHVGVPYADALDSLRQFTNAARRFQVLLSSPIRVVDDYAHHPTEIRSTLKAARQVSSHRVIALFQPQRYVRTKNLWDQFVDAFGEADVLYLTDIYSPPGDPAISGVTSQALAEEIRARHGGIVHFYATMEETVEEILRELNPGDTFITMGAGNVYLVAQRIVEQIQRQ